VEVGTCLDGTCTTFCICKCVLYGMQNSISGQSTGESSCSIKVVQLVRYKPGLAYEIPTCVWCQSGSFLLKLARFVWQVGLTRGSAMRARDAGTGPGDQGWSAVRGLSMEGRRNGRLVRCVLSSNMRSGSEIWFWRQIVWGP
jgi:hypothetical protein